jgi:hypothetical protein
MLRRIRELLSDAGIMEIAVGVLLGFAIVDLANAVSVTAVEFWRYKAPDGDGTAIALEGLFNRGIRIGDRYLDVAEIIRAVLQTVLILAAALLLRPAPTREAEG